MPYTTSPGYSSRPSPRPTTSGSGIDISRYNSMSLEEIYYRMMTASSISETAHWQNVFDERAKQDHYKKPVTLEMLKEIGFDCNENVLKRHVAMANEAVKKYGISDPDSLAAFLATCCVESDGGRATKEKGTDDYFRSHGYDKNTCGAGMIQITDTRDTKNQTNFLNAMEGQGAADRYTDKASHIANRYPWSSAAWVWTSKDFKTTSKGSINDWVEANGNSTGKFLMTQYWITGAGVRVDKNGTPIKENGKTVGINQADSEDLRDGNWGNAKNKATGEFYKDENGNPIIQVDGSGNYYPVPKNWNRRKEANEKAQSAVRT